MDMKKFVKMYDSAIELPHYRLLPEYAICEYINECPYKNLPCSNKNREHPYSCARRRLYIFRDFIKAKE